MEGPVTVIRCTTVRITFIGDYRVTIDRETVAFRIGISSTIIQEARVKCSVRLKFPGDSKL